MSELNPLTSIDELDPLIEESHRRPVMIFKHSLTCPISDTAYSELCKYLEARPDDDDSVVHALILIQQTRDVSQAVTERTGVTHASPQVLLLRNGEVVWHTSHGRISKTALAEAVAT